MSFCASLRRRSSCQHLVKAITASGSRIQLRENSLQTHDVHVPVNGDPNKRVFRAVILSPSAITPNHVQQTTARVERFHVLTGAVDCAIFFLQSSDAGNLKASFLQSQYQSFQNLQLLLIKQNMSIPLIYLPTAESLLDALEVYATPPKDELPSVPVASVDILPHTSLQTPMSKKAFTALSDAVSNLRELTAFAGRADAAHVLIGMGLHENEVEQILDFWADEFAVET